ncbi:MAG: hypothetical protein ACRD00_00755 [Thermoanaerobaculia bacterium]
MNYYWLDCPGCRCQVTVNATVYPDRTSGSLRRWSADRSINDGRPFDVPAARRAADGSFSVFCVCGREIELPATPSAVGGEREEDLRVKLG